MIASRGSGCQALLDPRAVELQRARLRELEERSAHLEAILECLPDSYARISADGIFIEFRRPKGRDFAVPVEDLRGRHFRDTLPEDAGAAWQVAIDEAKASSRTTVFEFILPTKKGRLNREARFTSCGNGEVIAVIRSTTQEKSTQAQLVLADRLASLGTLAAGVAHEINNPLMYLLANLEWIVESLPGILSDPAGAAAAAILTSLEEARTAGLRVGAIAHDLSVFARDSGDVIGSVDVHAVIDSALKMTQHTLVKGARVVLDLRPVPNVRGTEGRLVQVLLNLLVNANHAMQASRGDDDHVTLATFLDADGRVVITVRDTGAGIAAGMIDRVFDPFFTTKDVGVGTGLGLSISHGIITSFGGELRVESEVGRGTVFSVVLPVWSERPQPSTGLTR
jgi:C4-dicarboxylate-specific signal transduction histidine kinase